MMVASLMSSQVQVAEIAMPSALLDVPSARTFQSKEHHSAITPSNLSERWYIGLGQAAQMLKVTTQWLMCSTILPLAQQYRVDRMFIRPCIHGTIYTDTMNGRYKSLDGTKQAQIFANEWFFATTYPMEHKSSAGQALKQFIFDVGIPDKLVCDGAAKQVGKRTPEISEYLDFTFYDWCWYNDNAGLGQTKLGRWLCISHHVGSLMSYWILTQYGNVILHTMVS